MLTKKLLHCYNPHLTTENKICNDNKEKLTGTNHELYYSDNNHLIKIKIEGLITSIAFHKARLYAQKLSQHLSHKYAVPQIREMLEVDWHEYLQKMRVRIGGNMWILKRHVAVFINNVFIGSDIEFLNYINELYVFHMQQNVEYYEKLVKEYYKEFLEKTKRVYVYFTCDLNGSTIGSLLFMLYSDLLPHTCKHFVNLCTGKYESVKGFGTSHYLNTSIHRIVKNGWIQLGDIKSDSTDSYMTTIPTIPDESYCIPHNRRGVLSMANNGKHSNESQFIISLKPNAWMDYHYVAFGQLVDGIHVLEKIEDIPTYYESPLKKVIISQCGEYILDEEPQIPGETDIFLERSPWMDGPGESMDPVLQYPFNTYSDISMWLDNIIDEIDIRDTASLLIAERYFSELYYLSSRHLAEINVYTEKQKLQQKLDITCDLTIYELLQNFQPDTMNKAERTIFIDKLCKVIILYALNFKTECCTNFPEDNYETVHKVLEYAYDIARAIIAKSLRKDANIADAKEKINNYLKAQQFDDKAKEDISLSVIEDILNKAILYSLQSTSKMDTE